MFAMHFNHRRSQGCSGCTCTPRAETGAIYRKTL